MLIPGDTPPTGGNHISAERVRIGLSRIGLESEVHRYQAGELPPGRVYHAWNAVRVGMELVAQGLPPSCLVVTWTGTDLWQDWVADAPHIRQGLSQVESQVVFTEDARRHLLAAAPEWADRIQLIPPSVDTDAFSPDTPETLVGHPLVLVAGGIRPVKRSAWAIDLVESLRQQTGLEINVAIAGPVREVEEGKRVRERARTRPWVHLLGEVPKREMKTWYCASDVVLNCSEVEGVSNALMEAMACGALVAASDIPGNRYLVQDDETGLLFASEQAFVERVAPYLVGLRSSLRLRDNARQLILERHSLDKEAEAYRALYERCLGCVSWR
jgi:glycosyltransferase involved in cell wall biosynthesis